MTTIQFIVNRSKLLIIPALLMFGLVLASCDKFLDVDSPSVNKEADFYQNQDQAYAALLGIYEVLAKEDLYGYRINMIYTVDTDEGRNSSGTISDNSGAGLAHYNMTSDNTQLAGPYRTLYAGVARANTVIDMIPKMDMYTNGTASQQKQLRRMLGEALVLRAQCYFDLVKIWGDVPAIWESVDPEKHSSEYNQPRTSRDTIYDRIIADVVYAADSLLLSRTEGGNIAERISQGAAWGLGARYCLHAAGYSLRWNLETNDMGSLKLARRDDAGRVGELYELARELCSKVIGSGQHNLNPSYEQVFRNYMEFKTDGYGESMWEIGFAFANNTGGGRVGWTNSGRQSDRCRWGKGAGNIISLPTYFALFEPVSYTDQRIAKDKRRDVAICQYYITDSNTFELRNSTDYTAGKWRRHWMPEEANVGDKTSVNWVMLRYSDVLLMAAEAEFYLYGDNAPLGIEYINRVRYRGYNSQDFSVRVKNEDLRADRYSPDGKAHYAIIRERMLELGHEGLRKYDLIRWGLYAEYLNKMRDEMGTFSNGLDPYRTYQERDTETNQDVDVNYAWPPYINSLYGTSSTSAEILISNIAVGRENSSILLARTLASFGEEKISIVARDFKKLKHELYPIPSAELLTNPKLKQCPAY